MPFDLLERVASDTGRSARWEILRRGVCLSLASLSARALGARSEGP